MAPLWNADLLTSLCAAPGIAGDETAAAGVVRTQLDAWGITHETDAIGNLTAHLPGTGPKLALVAHLDEVGLMVRKVHPQGYLFVERIGGTSTHVLPGQWVDVWAGGAAIPGVVGAMPQHLNSNGRSVALEEIYIDIGASSRQAAEGMGIEVGSAVTYRPGLTCLQNSIASKALDDRMGCYLMLRLAQAVKDISRQVDLFLVFCVQEETLLRGAEPVMNRIKPDYAIGLDATLAFDTPDLADGQCDIRLGAGTVVKVMDHIRGHGMGLVTHLGLRRHLESLAVDAGIPFQREVVTGLSTAVAPLPYTLAGLPVAALSFPLRYAHSPVETVNLDDIEHTFRLLEMSVQKPWQAGG